MNAVSHQRRPLVTIPARSNSPALRDVVSRWPWRPGEPLSAAEGVMLRRYVASSPWRARQTGNGIVTPTGAVITWATYDENGEPDLEGAPWHELIIRALYPQLLGEYGDVRAAFKIDIDGSLVGCGAGVVPATERERITRHLARCARPWCERPATTRRGLCEAHQDLSDDERYEFERQETDDYE